MNFINYTLSQGEEISSPQILKQCRENLGLSQNNVANGAKIQLRQYQRFETGERYIESASMKTALSVCAVLKLDPFIFFPQAEKMNSYIETHSQDIASASKAESIQKFLIEACNNFNSCFDTHYSPDNPTAFIMQLLWVA